MMRDTPRLWTPRRRKLWTPRRPGVCDLLGITNLIGFGGGGIDSYSVNFDGSNDYLEVADNAAWDYGTGAFTLEGFFRFGSTASRMLCGRYNVGASAFGSLQIASSTQFYWYYGNGASYGFTTSALSTAIWYHLAACRDGSGNLRFFLDGTQQGSTQNDSGTNYGGTAPFRISAAHQSSPDYFSGDCSNFRVVKGSALYTANFTRPAEPLQAVTNTVLLTCQDGTIKDNSSNAFSITNSGGATVIAESPFG
jgi:hypothetical protein